MIEMQISRASSLAKIVQNHSTVLLYVFHIAFSELKKYSFNQLEEEDSVQLSRRSFFLFFFFDIEVEHKVHILLI